MIEGFVGDIWRFHPHSWVVIPTNLGWTKNGKNVMGAGLAKQAAQRFPDLPDWYGGIIRTAASLDPPERVMVLYDAAKRLALFPVKPLIPDAPHFSWRQDADLTLIEGSTINLAKTAPKNVPTCVPLVGCGNGKLDPKDVLPILRKYLDDRFILVRPQIP